MTTNEIISDLFLENESEKESEKNKKQSGVVFNFHIESEHVNLAPQATYITNNYGTDCMIQGERKAHWKKLQEFTPDEVNLYLELRDVDATKAAIHVVQNCTSLHQFVTFLNDLVVKEIISKDQVVKKELIESFRPFCPKTIKYFTVECVRQRINTILCDKIRK